MIKVNSTIVDYKKLNTKALIVGVFESQPSSEFKTLNELTEGEIFEEFKDKEFNGEFKKISLFHSKKNPKRILFIGLGKRKEFNKEQARECAGHAVNYLNKINIKSFTIELFNGLKPYDSAYAINEGIQLSQYLFSYYKTINLKKIKHFTEFEIKGLKNNQKDIDKAIKHSNVVINSVCITRDLQNEPSSAKNPDQFVKIIKDSIKGTKLKCKILSLKDIKKLGMNLILAVNKGSAYPAKFAILEHKGKGKETIVLVGKGITFDSGGIQIKPERGLEEMKYDMSGAAVILGTLRAASLLNLPINIVGLMPLTDNMPSGSAYKPGDIFKSYSGKTVEILHTDAEGRLILADALTYAKKYKPSLVIDLATLTGACVVALGNEYAGMFSNNNNLQHELAKAGENTYERLWPMPLVKEYKTELKSTFADIKNLGERGQAGAITAALFLEEFVDYPWAHLDIAGTAFIAKDKPYKPKGGTGFGVRLLIDFLENRKN
jgi:leucyl aminopeptidase